MLLFVILATSLIAQHEVSVSLIIKLPRLMDKEGYYFLAPFITPEVLLRCDTDLIQKAKEGGLDVIQNYVFRNGHEPSLGKYYFLRGTMF
jgi:hypothetical protein